MMDETPKFRVWVNVGTGHMYPVMGIQINADGSWTVNATDDYNSWNPVQVSGKWQVGYLMQAIGRIDKNKQEIFEGDIVDCTRYKGEEIYRVVIKDISSIPQEMFGSSLDYIEVVGNIFENRHLIPKKVYDDIFKELNEKEEIML